MRSVIYLTRVVGTTQICLWSSDRFLLFFLLVNRVRNHRFATVLGWNRSSRRLIMYESYHTKVYVQRFSIKIFLRPRCRIVKRAPQTTTEIRTYTRSHANTCASDRERAVHLTSSYGFYINAISPKTASHYNVHTIILYICIRVRLCFWFACSAIPDAATCCARVPQSTAGINTRLRIILCCFSVKTHLRDKFYKKKSYRIPSVLRRVSF